MNADHARDLITALLEGSERIAQIAAGLKEIGAILDAGVLVGGPGDQLGDSLRDKVLYAAAQMPSKFLELAGEIEGIVAAQRGAPVAKNRFLLPVRHGELPGQVSYSMADTLEAFASRVPISLVSPESLTACYALLNNLPADLSRGFFLECRLQPGKPQVDVSLHIDPGLDQGRDILAGKHQEHALPEAFWSNPDWCRVRDFCAQWADPESPLNASVASIWLEFDVETKQNRQNAATLAPSLFFSLKSASDFGPTLTQTVDIALAILLGQAETDRLRLQLSRCWEVLPAGAEIRWIGVMLPRHTNGVRLCIQMPAAALAVYLARIGWDGPEEEFSASTGRLLEHVDATILAFELRDDDVLPRVGLECRYHNHRQPETESRWHTFLDALIQNGLCTAEKGAAFLHWCGYTHEKLAYTATPQLLNRTVSHVKLHYEPGRGLEAKGYLSATLRPLKLERYRRSPAP